MIFKKINTFLSNYFNGNKISKAFSTLIFTLIFSSILFCSAYLGKASAQRYGPRPISGTSAPSQTSVSEVRANMKIPGTAVYRNSGWGNEFHILYNKTGLPENIIYTSYLPPKNTYNKKTETEHTLDPCGDIDGSGLQMIGRDCMIKIPFDCSTPPDGIEPIDASLENLTVDPPIVANCLNYSNVFHDTANEKKLNPKKCENGLRDKISCLTTDTKFYCHLINNPILGFNCKLAPCNLIPAQEYRRPGVNCLADCNDDPGKHISEAKFFMEGFNCLKSCNTSTLKTIGEHCVLEFNGYAMPLCLDYPGVTADKIKHFNKANRLDRRESCLDVVDLPICEPSQTNLQNCVKECHEVTDPRHNINCVNFNSASEQQYVGYKKKTCHSYSDRTSLLSNPGCDKIECHKLSDTELKNSKNIFSKDNGESSADYCIPKEYTNFSHSQFTAISNSQNPYLRDYLLDGKPCYNRGDTEEIETILSSTFYGSGDSKIKYLEAHVKGIFGDSMNDLEDKDSFYYNSSLLCPLSNASQRIECADYKKYRTAPYDCNSASYCQECESPQEICARNSDIYCYKNSINCVNKANKIYPICFVNKSMEKKISNSDDEYVSWFFRPNVPKDAIKERSAGGDKYLVYMGGFPITEKTIKPGGNGDIFMDHGDMNYHGYGKYWAGTFFASREITPPSVGKNLGIPGVGPGYICGMKNNFRGIPSDDAGYFKGEVKTTYEDDNKVSHEVEVCLRYASGSAPETSCGHRSCKTLCAFGICTKLCGIDVCRTLKITEGSNQNCQTNQYNFENWNKDAKCIGTFETGLDQVSEQTRVRIYKPQNSSNYICAVLEFHGITTRHLAKAYFDGSEYFEVPDPGDKTKTKKMCVSDVNYTDGIGCSGGIDSNSDDMETNRWRTSKIIKYIKGPEKEEDKETHYIDSYGVGDDLHSYHIDFKTKEPVNQTIGRVKFNVKRYFETSDCIQHQQRIPAPAFPSIATPSNAERLFTPSVEIVDKCRIATSGTNCDPVDETDFFKPAITIKYGKIMGSSSTLRESLSDLNTNYKIIKINNASSNKSGDYIIKAANTGISGIDMSQTVFIKKESAGSQPKLCLYKKIFSGADLTIFKEQVIECVNRKKPTRASINTSPSPAHTSLAFQVGFLGDEGDWHSSITGLSTQEFVFDEMSDKINSKEYLKKCLEITSQGFPICIERDECTLLNNECVENEKSLIIEKNNYDLNLGIIQQKEIVSDYCRNELLIKCNLRKGYELTAENQTLNTSVGVGKGFNAPEDPNYHGWFNEFCIVSGIKKLDDSSEKIYVERNITTNEQLGSCTKDPDCPTCNDIRCLRASCCKKVQSSAPLSSLATPHELGLCQSITNYLKSCPAISYGRNGDVSDLFFVGPSFLRNPDPSHTLRQASIILQGSLRSNTNNAEFEVAYAGTPNLKGKCSGFYKNKIDEYFPTANCDSNGVWQNFSNSCKMYACPAKKLPTSNPGANSLGQYPPNYDSTNSPVGSLRGFYEGYANWNLFQKTTILKESSTATSCIVGYAKKNATNGFNAMSLIEVPDPTLLSALNSYKLTETTNEKPLSIDKIKAINSLFGKYKGFTGGISPTRNCNQLGEWEGVTNSCERITCPPILFDEPAEAGAFNMNDYALSVSSTKVISNPDTPKSISDMPNKVKFKVTNNLPAPVYLSSAPASFVSGNTFLIKNRLPSESSASLISNQIYVAELITPTTPGASKYWRLINNDNDNVLNFLWQKSGGASFPIGYALRSDSNYPTSDQNDQHKITGTCNSRMGYNSINDNVRPQLICSSLGNWRSLINPCISDCGEVSNPVVADSPTHGYSLWRKSTAQVGKSVVESSTGCSNGYFKYPYPPLFDNEGAKKDFGYLAVGASGDTEFTTSDSYDAIADASDGATFVATAGAGENLTPSENNDDGTYYNLKIRTSNAQSQSVASSSSQEGVKTLFYLFNSSAPVTMDAGSQNVWSKINFSSFGTPEYSSKENLAENLTCRSPYSKLIFANKCIGKTTCSISLSDFTSYDATDSTCIRTNLGNGINGQQNNDAVVNSFGSGGGGGGGNTPGIGGSIESSININGTSGKSFYDQSFHVKAPTLSDALNKGLKVDLKVADTGSFNGQNGSVTIIESLDQDFTRASSVPRVYLQTGEHNHVVSQGTAGVDDVYIKYEMSGAGGGGGGQGLTQGTNGASGTKMTGGVFKVKSGTTLKIYVGGGGGAGKTKCAPAPVSFLDPNIIQPAIEIIEPTKKTNLAIKMLENYQLNPDQVIAHNTKIIDRDSSIKSPLAKIFSKISDIFISEGYAQVLKCGSFNHGEHNLTGNCSNWDSGNINYKCDCPMIQAAPNIYMGVRGFGDKEYGKQKRDSTSSLGYDMPTFYVKDDWLSSISFWNYTRARFECWNETDEWTDWFDSNIPNLGAHRCKEGYKGYQSMNDNIDRIQIQYYRDCGQNSYTRYSDNCACNANRHWNGSACANNACTIPAGTGYAAQNGSGSGSVNCGTGFTGTVTYTCPTNGGNATVVGSCTEITCPVPASAYITQTSVNYSATSATSGVTCKSGFAGSPTYTCTTNGAQASFTSSCAQITCSVPDTANVTQTSVNYTTTPTLLTCKTGFAGSPTYTCTGTGTYTPGGTACSEITCTVLAGTGYIERIKSGKSFFNCDAGFFGVINYTCTSANTASTKGASTTSGSCTPIKCTSPTAYNGLPIATTLTNLNYTGNSPRSISCSGTGYSTATYTCTVATNPASSLGIFTLTSNCSCSPGYSKSSPAGVCTAISCTVPPGTGYAAQPGKSATGQFDCGEGYYGTINYTCTSATTADTSGSCTPIKCNLPPEANSNLVPVANRNPPYREVVYAPLSNPKPYTCGSGYRRLFSSSGPTQIDATYTCVANAEKRNPSTVALQNTCVAITCVDFGGTIYNFQNGEDQTFNCLPNNGLWGQAKFRCTEAGQINWIAQCKYIQCLIPNNPETKKNTTKDGQWVYYSSDEVLLDCGAGYYYENAATRPRYTCAYSDNAQLEHRGILNFQGSCQRITCQIPATGSQFSLNSNIDGTSVDWTGSEYKTTTCKNGFYQVDPLKLPSYSCLGGSKIGELRTLNPCAPVTCDLPDRFGMLAKTNLEYGVNKTTSCDKPGYSGIVTYTCANPVTTAGKGAVTGVSSTCTESSCVATGNTLATFNTYVIQAGVSTLGAGGAGGKISSTIGFLNGGNGGSATTISRTSGSGGGGGSASMIATMDKRIIAIAGGGGGGAGGGGVENTYNASAKVSDVENLEIRLSSNVFGPYFIGEMQYSPINQTAQKTTGILSGNVSASSPTDFLLSGIPAGTFVSDIFFASYGNPTINFATTESLVLKYGSCNDPSSLIQSLNQCLGKESCSFNTGVFSGCQSLAPADKKFGLVASYYFKEPTLQVVNSARLPAYKIKEMSNDQSVPATDLRNGTVYTFLLDKEFGLWYKYPYGADEYVISGTVASNRIKVRFHRTNITFSPRLKTNQGSFPIKKMDEATGVTSSLSVGYIDDTKVYILTRDYSNWIIREYTSEEVTRGLTEGERVLPKRSCVTSQVSSTDAVNVSWSLPNSSCVNYCPGYDPVTKLGDNRINVGATKHSTSKGDNGIVYWNDTAPGVTNYKKFSVSSFDNPGIKSEDRKYTVFQETQDILNPSHFRGGHSGPYFALARKCNTDGSWDPPIPLCVYNNSNDYDENGIPENPATGTSYIKTPDGESQKYLKANTSEDVQSYCRSGYLKQTENQYHHPGSVKKYDEPKYKCMNSANNKVDEVYFAVVDNSERKPCARYCDVNEVNRASISTDNKSGYKVRFAGDVLVGGGTSNGIIEFECNTSSDPQYMSTLPLKPRATCIRNTSNIVGWIKNNNVVTIEHDCREISRCVFNSNEEMAGFTNSNYDNYIFPVSKYVLDIHQKEGMKSGQIHRFDTSEKYQKHGKCGYCIRDFNYRESLKTYSKRKYLRAYSCYDGVWSYEWDNEVVYLEGKPIAGYNVPGKGIDGDPNINLTCDGSGPAIWHQHQWEQGMPAHLYLGDCDKRQTYAHQTYNVLGDNP